MITRSYLQKLDNIFHPVISRSRMKKKLRVKRRLIIGKKKKVVQEINKKILSNLK